MARKRSKSKKRAKRSAPAPVAAASKPMLEWASDHRYQLAAGAAGVAALVYFWPRTADATQLPPPAPVVPAGPPPLTPEQIVQMQTDEQRSLGLKIGVGAFAVVAAGVIYYSMK